MKYLIIIISALTLYFTASAQEDVLSLIPSKGKKLNNFIPNGYKKLFQTKGDLNGDGQQDIALIIYSEKMQKDTITITNEDGSNAKKIEDINPAILIILFKQENQYKVQTKTLNAINYLSIDNMFTQAKYEPYDGAKRKPIVLYKGGLNLYTYFRDNGWATIFQAEFKYTNNDLYLIRTINNYYTEVEYCNKAKAHPGIYRTKDYLNAWEITKDITQAGCKLTIDKSKLNKQTLVKLSDFNINNYQKDFY